MSVIPKRDALRVTDHALIRYLERAMGLNIDIVRQHMETICAGPAAIGAVCVRAEGVRFEICNNAIVTVRPDSLEPSNTSRKRSQRAIERRNPA